MIKMKIFTLRKYLFFLFVCIACANVQAQTEEGMLDTLAQEYEVLDTLGKEKYYVDDIYINLLNFSITNQIPLETFAKNLTGTSFGVSVSYYNNFSKKDDLFWGIHFSSFRIDKLTNTFNVQEQFVEYDLFSKTKTNNIFLGYGLKYYLDFYTDKFEPFVDIKMGGNFIYTYTSETIVGTEDSEVDFNNSDLSFAYAVGIGAQYNVRQGQAVHFTVNYNGGTSATYYINADKGFQEPFDNFVRRTTQLDYLQFAGGLTIGF